MSREWGIYPDIAKPRQWCGTRAIIENGRIYLLSDRQNYERDGSVSDTDKANMFFWMSHEMNEVLQKNVKRGGFMFGQENFVIESESGRFRCEANSKNSGGGYLYIGCWEV